MSSLRNRRSVAALLLFGGLAACDEPVPITPPDGGGGTTPLAITSTSPAADVLTAPFGLVITANTDAPLQASTATVTSFNLVTDADGFDVPRRILVTGGNQLQATASLLPGTKYRATISTALLSTNGGSLPAPFIWSFTTRPIVPFVLDTGRVGYFGHVALAKDSLGGLHAVYADSVLGELLYSECAAACTSAASWIPAVTLATLGNNGSSSAIAMDASNRVHIVFRSDQLQSLQYATCVSPCTDRLQFTFATVDNSSIEVGLAPSIWVEPSGIVHTTYFDNISTYLRYARCPALCGLSTNWETGFADQGGAAALVGESSAIIVDGATRHVVYEDKANGNLKYATCTTDCVGGAIWSANPISLADGGKNPSLAFGPNKELEVTYYASITGAIKFAFCASACITLANWTTIDLTTTGLVGQVSGLTVDPFGRAQAVLIDDDLERLRYATCSSVCTSASRWRYATIEVSLDVFRSPALVPGGAGGVQLLYLSSEGQAVRFAQ